ncbi:MAG: transcriptional repressor LexA [Oligoflexales bacterium]
MSLTDRQKEVLAIIENNIKRAGYFPSLREIADKLGVNNKTGIAGHIKALEKKGFIKRQGPKASMFALRSDDEENLHSFPLVATIPAGLPRESFEDNFERVAFDQEYFGTGDLQAVKVSGDSMAGDCIRDGDIGIIKLQKEANPKDIVAVRIADEVTLKRIKKNRESVDLIASNPSFPKRSVPASDVQIVGKLVGLIRRV